MGAPVKDRYYDNHFGLYCNRGGKIDFESEIAALSWLRQFEIHAAMTENAKNILKIFRDTVVSLMIESGYSVIKLNFLKKQFCDEIATSMDTAAKRKADFPSPPRKYIKGISQSSWSSSSVYLDDFIPLTQDTETTSPLLSGSDNAQVLKGTNFAEPVCCQESSAEAPALPLSLCDPDYLEAVLNTRKPTQPFKCEVHNCPVCLLSPNCEQNVIVISPESWPDSSEIRNPSPPSNSLVVYSDSEPEPETVPEPPSPASPISVSIFNRIKIPMY